MSLGPVAQSVEQRIENPCVGGSIPPQATKLLHVEAIGNYFNHSRLICLVPSQGL